MPLVGFNHHFYCYSSTYHTWMPIALFPGGVREGCVAFVINDKAYIGLGSSLEDSSKTGDSIRFHDDFYVYDSKLQVWESETIKFPGEARAKAVAFSINGKGYVGTGYSDKQGRFADFYEFDPETGWIPSTSIPRARSGACAFVANGYGYVCFGEGAKDIQKFDPESQSWKSQSICYERSDTARLPLDPFSSFVLNKKGQDFVFTSKNWGYNPEENVWKQLDYPVFGEYMFTIGEQGLSMQGQENRGGFSAKIFKITK